MKPLIDDEDLKNIINELKRRIKMESFNVGDRVRVYGKGYSLEGEIVKLEYEGNTLIIFAHIITDDGLHLKKDTRYITKL